MNKKQYRLTLIIFAIIGIAAIAVTAIWFNEYMLWAFIGVSVIYIYIRYKVTSPLQNFSTKFNMLVDYDLDVEEALKLAKEQYENAPTEQVSQLIQIYLGMGYYYNAQYREAINTFNQIKLNKVNTVYHVLIFAFTAYAAYEIDDTEAFNIAVERVEHTKNKINKRYFAFAASYLEILQAMSNLESNPETYKEVIERNFSREDGYISTKLVYNYRMAIYYKTVGNVEEMDKCLARVIANGKNHHTAIRAKEMFQGTVENIDDYKFSDPGAPLDVEVVEDQLQISQLDEVEKVENEPIDEPAVLEELAEDVDEAYEEISKEPTDDPFESVLQKERVDYSTLSVSKLKELCKDRGIAGYSKLRKNELIAALERYDV